MRLLKLRELLPLLLIVTALICVPSRLMAGLYNLSDYQLVTHIPSLPDPPGGAADYSGVAYNPNTGTLFILSNGNSHIFEYSTTGTFLRRITTTGFTDSEDIVHMGGTQFAIVEEGLKSISMFNILPLTTSLTKAGSTVITPSGGSIPAGSLGNSGFEGLAYNSSLNSFYVFKEQSSRGAWRVPIATPSASINLSTINTTLNSGAGALTDYSGAYFDNNPGGNIYVVSHLSNKITEVTTGGVLVNTRVQPGTQVEGITFSPDMKNMYIVGEAREYFHYTVPEPSSALLLMSAIPILTQFRRRLSASS